MADLALSATQTLLTALQFSVVNEVSSMRHYKIQLDKLMETVSTIQKVLLVAEAHPQLPPDQQDYVEKLKDAVYDADDLFDEFLTLAHLKKLNKGSKASLQKVSDFFSSKNSLVTSYNTSREVKKVREKLESIADDHNKFSLQIDNKPIRDRREETCHYVYEPAIIGREKDVKEVVDRLLGAPEDNIDFLTIVGVGGLGKTAVAQLVYADERVEKEFPKRLWVCVSDESGHQFDVKDILLKILDVEGHKIDDRSSLESAFSRFQKTLGGSKCLLVLDDVWNENPHKWSKLREYLMILGRGSRVLATTRSVETAKVIGGGDTRTYRLEGLSDEDSSKLFNLTAFGDEGKLEVPLHRHPELVKISEKILKKCSNVPLAIKVAGSLLYGQEMSKWREFEENGLRNLSLGGDNIIPILKLSYDNLEPSLKSCFSYCAVFPKDFVIKKEMLISLWMAQGYIEESINGKSLEDVGNEIFLILLRRCFFQDVEMDNYGDIRSCKVHDLMHDVAQKVAGREMCVASYFRSNSDYQKGRHIFEDRRNFENDIFVECKIRSYLQFNGYNFGPTMLNPLVANWKCLRTLTIKHAPIEELPSSVGKLLHLRYINLYDCRKLKKLPNTITNLHNLQTLILNYCDSLKELPKDLSRCVHLRHLGIRGCELLKELPKDFSKLVQLRHLDISGCQLLKELPKDFSKLVQLRHLDYCDKLSYMPSGIGKLTGLCRLTEFKVGNGSSCGQLKDLKGLLNLRGDLSIKIPENLMKENEGESGYLVGMEQLKSVSIGFFGGRHDDEERVERDETLMNNLQPHANLREFELWNYKGRRIPRWGDNWASFLPNLVQITLGKCRGLQHLPTISQLEHLRTLTLIGLDDMEYVEEDIRSDGGALSSRSLTFFPSLVQLEMTTMPKVKGWFGRKGVELVADQHTSSFPSLTKLTIKRCPNLIAMLHCPAVDQVYLEGVNTRLRLKSSADSEIKVREVRIGHVADLGALPPCHFSSLFIHNPVVENFSGAGEVFQAHNCFYLRHLCFSGCFKLRSLKGGGFQHLTNLESLSIEECPVLKLNEEDDGDGIPWRSLHHSLLSLDLGYLCSNKDLIVPRGVRYLSNLQQLNIPYNQHLEANLERISCLSSLKSLTITYSSDLKSIPEGMRSLTSLGRLRIHGCSKELMKRCRNPNGEDWHKIQHIPDLKLW